MREQEPSWPAAAQKPPQDSEVLSDIHHDSGESFGSEEEDISESGSEGSMEQDSDEDEGSISDEYDSDTEWDEAKLEKANERKYWSH